MIKQIRVLEQTQSLLFLLQTTLKIKYNKFYSMDRAINWLLDKYTNDQIIINEALANIYQIEDDLGIEKE